jgi:alanyl-tRNA synthetase
LAQEVRDLKKQLAAGGKAGSLSVDKLLAEAGDVAGVKVVIAEVPGGTADVLRELIDQVRRKTKSSAVLLGSRADGKVVLVAGISRDLEAKGVHAGEWVRTVAKVVGGNGGGRADMAQAGGKDPERLVAALDQARDVLGQWLA